MKTVIEAVMTPVTYAVVGSLKRQESEDYYDTDTDFNPFSISLGRDRQDDLDHREDKGRPDLHT